MKREDFIQASTHTRVLEKNLLKNSFYDRLIESESLEDAVRILDESSYQKYFLRLDSLNHFEKAFGLMLQEMYKEALWISPDKDLIRLLELRYDYHNYKVFLKELLLKENLRSLYIDYGSSELLKERETLLELDETVRRKEFPPFYEEVVKKFEETKDATMIDLIVDQAYFKELLELTKKLDSDVFTRYVKEEIDFTNLKTLLRLKKQDRDIEFLESVLIEGGTVSPDEFESLYYEPNEVLLEKWKGSSLDATLQKGFSLMKEDGRISGLEKVYENHVLDAFREARRITFGPEVLFSYLLEKENEVKNLRMILVGKANGVSKEAIRERLRGIDE
ncbi:V-type ATP synthase subunit C [Guggenheimella bovis]